MSYQRSVDVVQNEEYLSEADKNVIRKKRETPVLNRFKRQLFGGGNPLGGIGDTLKDSVQKVADTAKDSGLLPDVLSGAIQSVADIAQAIIDLALAMVPGGFPAISISPPFKVSRTYPAVAVIFQDLDPSIPNKPLPGASLRDKAFEIFPVNDVLANIPDVTDVLGADAVIGKLFGFAVTVRLVEEECTLGVTCDADGNEIGEGATSPGGLFKRGIYKRATGEEFSSNGPPECRTVQKSGGC